MGVRDWSKEFQDFSKHVFDPDEYVIVPEAQYAVVVASEPCIAIGVYRLIVLTAIDFNDQTLFDTGEVGDEGTDRVLSAKAAIGKLATAQATP